MKTNYLSGGTQYQNLLTMMETTEMMSPCIISLLGLALHLSARPGFWMGPACFQTDAQLLAAHKDNSPSSWSLSLHSRVREGKGRSPSHQQTHTLLLDAI